MNPNIPASTHPDLASHGTGASSQIASKNDVPDITFIGDLFAPIKASAISKSMAALAGTTAAASLAALAYYAYQKTGFDPTYVVDPSLITHVANFGSREQVDAVIGGMGQINQIFDLLNDKHGGNARVFDLWQELKGNGVSVDTFKSSVVDHFTRTDGSQSRAIIDKLLDPDTRLTSSVQARLGEVIWAHDKAAVMREVGAQEGLQFAKAGFGTAMAASAAAVFTHPKITRPIQQGFEAIKAAASRVGAELGLINDDADRSIRQTIKASAFDPTEARAQLAAEYAERESSTHRFFTLTWMKVSQNQDRSAMLQLFGMEKLSLGKHTTVGQAIMIDNFSSKELADLASKEPNYADTLKAMSLRRGMLEHQGKRPANLEAALGNEYVAPPDASIAELMTAYQDRQMRKSRSTAPA